MKKKAQIHKAAVTDIPNRDQIIASYQERAKCCSHAMEVMLNTGISKDVAIDVIQGLNC